MSHEDRTQHGPNDSGISQASAVNVSIVYARLPVPQMSSCNIEAWFTTMDFWFTASGITADRQKTATVLAALDPNIISQLSEVIATLPQTDRYDFVKSNIIEHFADSEQRRLNRLLSELPLGDKKPSELCFEMKRVAGNTLVDAALKGLWAKRLPGLAQPVVAASTGSPAKFTRIADSVLDAMTPSQIQQVQLQPTNEISELRAAINELGKKFEKLSTRSRSRSRAQTAQRYRSKSRPPYVADTTGYECWYHKKYGRNAQICRSSCRHKQCHANATLSTISSSSN